MRHGASGSVGGEMESEERAPIKWMAPETIENDVYTEATDVVGE